MSPLLCVSTPRSVFSTFENVFMCVLVCVCVLCSAPRSIADAASSIARGTFTWEYFLTQGRCLQAVRQFMLDKGIQAVNEVQRRSCSSFLSVFLRT